MRVLMRLINFLVVISLSGAYICRYFEPADFQQQLDRLLAVSNLKMILLVAAIALLALNLWGLLAAWRSMRRRIRAIEVSTDGGMSVVSLDAVRRSLSGVLVSQPDVRNPRLQLTIKSKGKPVFCRIEFGLRRDHDITGRVDELKRVVSEAFGRLLPGGPGLRLVASVTDIEAEQNTGAASTDSAYFTGPVYPDGNDKNAEEE